MGIPTRAPRQPAAGGGGGRTLLLLGVLLALAAGAIAIFVVSQYSGGGGQTETVVVANTTVPAGTMLTSSNIKTYFGEKTVVVSSAPTNAYVYISDAALDSTFGNKVVAETIYQGDYLFNSDQRIVPGAGPAGSLTNLNPNAITSSEVIAQLTLSGQVAVVPGDYVDILATECNLPGKTNGCETQTTLQNVLVYSVNGNTIYLVLGHEAALQLKYLSENGTLELAIRSTKEGTATVTTTAVDGSTIVTSFNF